MRHSISLKNISPKLPVKKSCRRCPTILVKKRGLSTLHGGYLFHSGHTSSSRMTPPRRLSSTTKPHPKSLQLCGFLGVHMLQLLLLFVIVHRIVGQVGGDQFSFCRLRSLFGNFLIVLVRLLCFAFQFTEVCVDLVGNEEPINCGAY